MNILALSDVHGSFDVYRWMGSLVGAGSIDAVVLAGDLLHGAGDEESVQESQRREAEQLVEVLLDLKLPVLYIMGNDDLIELDYEDDLVQPLHGRSVSFGDLDFVGYQFSPPFMGGVHEKPEEEIGKDLEELESQLHERTILVTHTPALGHLDEPYPGVNVGSPNVLEAISRNKIQAHIHGHIHQCFGRDGIHFNVASGRAFRAMQIDLTEMEHTVLTRTPRQER